MQQGQIQEALTNLLSTTNVAQQLELLLKQLWHLFPIEYAGVVLFGDDTNDDQVIVTSSNAADLRALCSRPDILRNLCKEDEIQRIDQEPVCAEYCKLPVLLIPLGTSDEFVGAMVVAFRKDTLDLPDTRLLTTYAKQAALAVVQARMIDKLQSSQAQLIQSERLAAVGTLAASLSHEFNNVLAIICTTAEAAVLQRRSEAHLRALRVISTTAKRGGRITHGLLTFTRQFDLHRQRIVMQDAIEPVLAMLTTRFRENHVTLVRDLMPGLTLSGDLGLLSQAVLNLVTNSLDVMPRGGTLTIKTWRDERNIWVSVQDTGPGIPDEIRARLFEPFTTSKHIIDFTHGGSGLGLAITYGIVTSHSGTIEIESNPGLGTTIAIGLPAVGRAEEPEPAPSVGTSLEGTRRIMVVDDEPLIAMGLAQILETAGYDVVWFDDPEAALTEIERQAPDVLMADIQMPKLDGLTLLRYARELAPSMRQILVTGQLQAHHRRDVIALGVEVVYKPFSATDIHSVLGGARVMPALDDEEQSMELALAREERTEEQRLRDDLRHQLINHISALEGTFHILQRVRASDSAMSERMMMYIAQTICEMSVFVRSQRLLGLMDQTGKKIYLDRTPFMLGRLLNEARDWISAGLSADERINLRMTCPDGLEIVGDPKVLVTAILAALHNALESMRRHTSRVHNLTISVAQADHHVMVKIEDTGVGFEQEMLDQIAAQMGEGEGEQFIAKLEPRCGIGLGIAVMVRVVGWHGGRVTFGNGEERGAWTQFVLPLPSAAQPEVRDTLQTSAREPLFSY